MPDLVVDLRSDTVTRPTREMRRAMAEAEVGDDVFGEDPTVRLLEEEGARLTGMEAALFVPTGTLGNQIAVHLHTCGRCDNGIVRRCPAHVGLSPAYPSTPHLQGHNFTVDPPLHQFFQRDADFARVRPQRDRGAEGQQRRGPLGCDGGRYQRPSHLPAIPLLPDQRTG